MNKTTNSNIYYSPNHDLRMNDCLTISLVSSPLDLNNIIILNTISKGMLHNTVLCVIPNMWLQLSGLLFCHV